MINPQELSNKQEASRFIIRGGKTEDNKLKALEIMSELNKIEEPFIRNEKKTKLVWRVGITTASQFIMDVDNHRHNDLMIIVEKLKNLFHEEFTVIKTLNGYQIIGKEQSKTNFKWKHIKVLNTDVERNYEQMKTFELKLEKFLERFNADNPEPPKNEFNYQIKKSGLIKPIGEFDYLYNVLAVLKGHSTIRITPKRENDKWEVII